MSSRYLSDRSWRRRSPSQVSRIEISFSEVILAFWLDLAYDVIEDRRMIEVIITKCFRLYFNKMTESFDNLDKFLHDWEKIRYKKTLVEALKKYKKQEEVRKSLFCFF